MSYAVGAVRRHILEQLAIIPLFIRYMLLCQQPRYLVVFCLNNLFHNPMIRGHPAKQRGAEDAYSSK